MTAVNELLLPAGTTDVVRTGDGADLAVTVLGEGPAVVLAHGWTEHRQVWAPVARRLVASGHRVVLYDQRGHGSSSVGSDRFCIRALGDDLRAVLEHVDVTDAVLAGHSMGGMSILSLAEHHGEALRHRARGVALVSTAAADIGKASHAPLAMRVLRSRPLERLYRSRLGPSLLRATVGRVARREHLRLGQEMFLACTRDARAECLGTILTLDQRAVLATMPLPTVVLVGTLDRLLPPRFSDTLVAGIAGARLVSLDELGHQLPLEAPDEVAAAVAGLAGASAGTAAG